ncbi:metal ABC transporter ATP-binding protein [Aliarcobacter cibarius]|jgi:zinc transport system ATP-binding protein|uniref:ATP-binding cassette domain-containing protein n=1 Tax=Aliarcobacter cibarius TaxID=255507 RepID=A0ABY2V672_9BACT|nr:ATP-binding cassette domain-containing protein [Aliarcobacter cibarius]QEZ90110.1 zinc ABC transporter, ATP-binding protein [Aliarcobacter cibarius]TLT00487.1 ATP-binding cassette domain-containing protein [Aliarcobacter cibarius]TLT00765.1 ATP-binding cassette domain-containing protein [Aliarcobacter cibarius]
MNKKLIEVCDLNFENILSNISLEIFESDFIAIVGSNGGGKTTFLKLLLNILKPNSGEIQYFENIKNKMGYVPQNATVVDVIFPATVKEILETAFITNSSILKKISKNEKDYLKFLMQNFEITNLNSKLFAELSGGQKQRVMIVKALANKPKILFLDEPDMGLDKISQSKFIDNLNRINKENKTSIVFITHHLGMIEKYITKTFCINGILK